jgi:hypothetical protein
MYKPESCINLNPEMIQVYSGFRFIQDSGLYMIQVYSGFRFIHDSGLFRVQVYSGFRFIHDSGLMCLHSETCLPEP